MRLHELTALEQAQALRGGQFSSEELVRHYFDRIDRYNPQLHAFSHVAKRSALKQARNADKALRKLEANEGPLFLGVPTGIKDLVPTRGQPTRLGSRAYRYMIGPSDGAVARFIYDGGFVSLGKLTTSEFGVLPTTEPEIHPPTRNPWNQARTPGGSSGGSGSAVAAGLLPIAHGSDGGGSVRIPSALCHLFGFKPSLSLLGNLHGKYNQLGLSVMGPLAHNVADAAGMLDVMARRPNRRSAGDSCLAACDQAVGPLRIALLTESTIGDVDEEILDAVQNTARLLEEMGHIIEPVRPADANLDEFLPVWQFAVSGVPALSERLLMPVTRWLRESGKKLPFEQVEQRRQTMAQKIHNQLDGFDLCLSPTVPIPAPLIGEFDDHSDPEQWFKKSAPLGAFTAPFNLTHGPAASLPAGLTQSGLPIGVQVAGHPGADHLVLALSAQLEAALDWRSTTCRLFH
ncbi:MAG: amidase [Myxococcota bacterium]|nr:amidase [Myxococcota bacterium]